MGYKDAIEEMIQSSADMEENFKEFCRVYNSSASASASAPNRDFVSLSIPAGTEINFLNFVQFYIGSDAKIEIALGGIMDNPVWELISKNAGKLFGLLK